MEGKGEYVLDSDLAQLVREADGGKAGRWSAVMSAHWDLGKVPSGGFVTSLMVGAAKRELAYQKHTSHTHCMSCTTHFLNPTKSGHKFTIVVTLRKVGRSVAHLTAEFTQNETVCVTSLLAFGPEDHGAPIIADTVTDTVVPQLPPLHECRLFDDIRQGGGDTPILHRFKAYVAKVPEGTPATKAEYLGYMQMSDGRPLDSVSIPAFLDGLPPSILALAKEYGYKLTWVPTLAWNVIVPRAPVPSKWIRFRLRTLELSAESRLVEEGVLWDDSGRVVGVSRQLALFGVSQTRSPQAKL